jgi:hypothetical protein
MEDEIERLRAQIRETLEVLTYTFGPTDESDRQRVAKVLELRELVGSWSPRE